MGRWNELAEHVESAWRSAEYDNRRFPRIASDALLAADVARTLTVSDLLEHVFDAPLWPVPLNSGTFGQPPVPLVTTPRFYIEALLWQHGTTSIHQHRFSGAFALVTGESIHTCYQFEVTDRVNAHFQLGSLSAVAPSQLLHAGDVREIASGPSFIHAVYHRASPTVTVVVRTAEDADAHIQHSYTRTGIALDPYAQDARFDTCRRTLDFVKATDEKAFVHRLFDVLTHATLWEASRLLERHATFLEETELLGFALGTVEKRHGRPRAQAIAGLLQESAWTRTAQRTLSRTEEPVQRLTMEAALTCASLDDALGIVEQGIPGHREAASAWLTTHGPPSWR